ncbi:MAG: pectate lyase [Thermogutta sp.]
MEFGPPFPSSDDLEQQPGIVRIPASSLRPIIPGNEQGQNSRGREAQAVGPEVNGVPPQGPGNPRAIPPSAASHTPISAVGGPPQGFPASRQGPAPSMVIPALVLPAAKSTNLGESSGKPTPSSQAEGDLADVVASYAPSWLISGIVHMLILIVMALIMLPQVFRPEVELTAEIYAEKLGDQLEFDSPFAGTDREKLEEPLWTPPDLPKVADPFAAPPPSELVPDGATSTSDIQSQVIGYALKGRDAGTKQALLGLYGGTKTTEAAVLLGLQWLARQQLKDGCWSLTGPYPNGCETENPEAATALALLAFQGQGNTHKTGQFRDEVSRAWNWLLQQQDENGNFFHEGNFNHRFYTQGLCTIAICEIYGMTKDERFREPASRAIDYLIKSQSSEGGWRYTPNADSDVSVTGWIVMALQSARMGGFEVPQDVFRRVERFLDRIAIEGGSKYPYQKGGQASLAMTAEGLLMRQFLGWSHSDDRLVKGVTWITQPVNLINFERDRDVYYWYYATQVCHNMEGDFWHTWNSVMRQALPEQQIKTGQHAGSWDPTKPSRDAWANEGGRLYVTCLSIYCLEVYYRHLPLYSPRALRLVGGL